MFIKKCILVNWGNIPNTEFEFGPINLFSGGNGSGKTTAADAIQTVMTAAYDYLFTYNPGQDETTQRGKGGKTVRTLSSYVLGCDDGSYARLNPTDGYIALFFYPTKGESAEPFTALVGVRAHLDRAGNRSVARQDELSFFVLPGVELFLEGDLIKTLPGGVRRQCTLDQIYSELRKKFGETSVERYDTKKAYLKRLYGALRGKREGVTEREAMHAAKAFSRFMAYKPVRSINEFVATEILEKKDLGEAIRAVSDLMKTIHSMEADATHLKSSIALLTKMTQHAHQYIAKWIEQNVLHYLQARHQYLNDQHIYLEAKRQQKALLDERDSLQQSQQALGSRQEQTHEQLLELTAKRMGFKPLQQKDELEKRIAQLSRQLQDQAPHLLTQYDLLQKAFRGTEVIQRAISTQSSVQEAYSLPSDLSALAKQFMAMEAMGKVDFTALLGRDWIDLAPLERHLDDALALQQLANQWHRRLHDPDLNGGLSLRDAISKETHRREALQQKLATQQLQKQAEIDSLESRQVTYPPYVRAALEVLRRDCPEADPRVLCDYVEVKDPNWQSAIEGYIGGARFSILVEPDCEADAIRLLRQMPGRDNRARVIQGEKARQDAEKMQLDRDSIIHVMDFAHATARYYLMASYGNVVRVDDEEALRMTRRGITANGLGSGAYSMYRCDLPDSELVFGQEARERALRAKQKELTELLERAHQYQGYTQDFRQLLQAVDQVQRMTYADRLQVMLKTHREVHEAEVKLAQLDLTDFEALEQKLAELKQQQDALNEQIEGALKREGALDTELKKSGELCVALSTRQGMSEKVQEEKEANLRKIVSLWPDFDVDIRLEEADDRAQWIKADALSLELDEVNAAVNSTAHAIESAVMEHNQRAHQSDSLYYVPDYTQNHSARFFSAVCALSRDADKIHNRLKNNILVEKQEKLTQLKTTFNNTFVTHLCHEIHQAITDGKKILETMNQELAHHQFGADKESFRFDWAWVPEFKEYWDFFEEVRRLPNLGDGTTLFEAELSDKNQSVRDRMMQMLLSDDELKSMKELERISDYRNYRSYEIYKQPEGKAAIALSQYGTGSGGQLETPAYIIRSAAITSAFRFDEGDSHLRMVLVDEAFSKMDESRSREVIRYLTETLGLQLLFIMPTSKSGPFMDLISNQFVFSKCPSAQPVGELNTRVLVDRQKCNQEKIKDLWEQHRRTIRQQYSLDFMEAFE